MSKNKPPAPTPHYHLQPTQDIYHDLHHIVQYMNYRLFGDQLPDCLLALRSGLPSMVCLSQQKVQDCNVHSSDTLLFNPADFSPSPSVEWLAALAKALVHLWQRYFGTPSRYGYHNREWATKMKTIGLHPSQTGEHGGRETGDKMRYWIIEGGLLEQVANELIADKVTLRWQQTNLTPTSPRSGKRITYQCPACGLKAWAKHDAALICAIDQCRLLPL